MWTKPDWVPDCFSNWAAYKSIILDSKKPKKDKWDFGMYGSKKEKKDNSLIKPWK